jgi:hypothetical protein
MTKGVFDTHPVYCSCCPGNPQVVAMKLGDELLEIRSRKHGAEHVAVVLLDKQRDKALDSKE